MMDEKDRLDLLERAQKVLTSYLAVHSGDRISESLRRLIHVCSDCLAVNCMEGVDLKKPTRQSGLRITAKEDGVWLELTARNGNQALINLSSETTKGSIVGDVLLDVAKENQSKNSADVADCFLQTRWPGISQEGCLTYTEVFLALQDYAAFVGAGRN